MNTLREQLINVKNEMDKEIQNNLNRNQEHEKREINNSNTNRNELNIKKEVKRKDLWYVDLGQRQGSLQSNVRPCLIDSNDMNNKYSNVINVYPLTSKLGKSNIPVHVTVEGFNLKEKSIILVEQGTSIDVRYQLLTYIGSVDNKTMEYVDRARDIQHGKLDIKKVIEFKPKETNTIDSLPKDMKMYVIRKLKMIETCNSALEFLQKIKGDNYSIQLTEDEKFKEENSLQDYCDKNKLNYEEMINNYNELKNNDEMMVAL